MERLLINTCIGAAHESELHVINKLYGTDWTTFCEEGTDSSLVKLTDVVNLLYILVMLNPFFLRL